MARNTESRAEWLLMYRRGMDPADIARFCHSLPATVEGHLREMVDRDPAIFDTRLGVCREPSLPLFTEADADRGWNGNRCSLLWFVGENARLPRRSADTTTVAGALEVFLYQWLRAQRRASAAGDLTAVREKSLEEVPGWIVLGRAEMHARQWERRLAECVDFRSENGRPPRYRGGTTVGERGLGAWLYRQHAKASRGTLAQGRSTRLAEHFPEGLTRSK